MWDAPVALVLIGETKAQSQMDDRSRNQIACLRQFVKEIYHSWCTIIIASSLKIIGLEMSSIYGDSHAITHAKYCTTGITVEPCFWLYYYLFFDPKFSI